MLTPNAALLSYRGGDDMTVAKVEARTSELRTTHGLEILAVRGELGRVTVSIARPKRQTLHRQQVWQGWSHDGGQANARLRIPTESLTQKAGFLRSYRGRAEPA